jgi:hypothetical protein
MSIATMVGLSGTELLVVLGGLILLLAGKNVREFAVHLAEAINNLRGGGPAAPSHPLPADDNAILTRRRRFNKHARD